MSFLAVLLSFCLCLGVSDCARCPDLRACQCFWDLNPQTTVCRVNVLQLKRGGVVQSTTQSLILHTDIESLHVSYDVSEWLRLESLFTVNRIYVCSNGTCDIMVTSTSTSTNKKFRSPKRRTTTWSLPACFTSTEVITTVMAATVKFSCSTDIYVGEHIRVSLQSWNIYLPVICVFIIILIVVILYVVKRRRQSVNSDNQSLESSSMCLYDMPQISPTSPAILETSVNYGHLKKETECGVAYRTRLQTKPIAQRLRSSRKDS